MIGVVNYGIGNLTSILNALNSVGVDGEFVEDPNRSPAGVDLDAEKF